MSKPSKPLTAAELAEIRKDLAGEWLVRRYSIEEIKRFLATIDHLQEQLLATQCDMEKTLARCDRWNVLHELMECGHPRACCQDRNWPESEQNYDEVTRTSDPPMEYRCVACESESSLRRTIDHLAAVIHEACEGIRRENMLLEGGMAALFQAEEEYHVPRSG